MTQKDILTLILMNVAIVTANRLFGAYMWYWVLMGIIVVGLCIKLITSYYRIKHLQ